MSITPEELYARLGSLVAEMPDLANGPITPEIHQWLGRAAALVESTGDLANLIQLRVKAQSLNGVLRANNAQAIAAIVHEALAKAELNAPAAVRGTFIAAGQTFTAFAAVGKVLGTATSDILMVDPYADEKVLTDYAVLAPDNVTVRLLAEGHYKKSLKPAAEHWVRQFGTTRPLFVRLAPPKRLHDREILIDGNKAWSLGQSFNKLAERSLTALALMDAELGALKIAAYEDVWDASTPLSRARRCVDTVPRSERQALRRAFCAS